MPSGITIYGDSGAVQVDENYFNYALVAKGTATLLEDAQALPNGAIRRGAKVQISVQGESPIIAWSSGFPLHIYRVSVNAGVWSFVISSGISGGSGYPPGLAGNSFTYYVFDRPSDSGGGFGFQVFDAAGRLTFDATRKYMRVVRFYETSDPKSMDSIDTTLPGKTYAATTCICPTWWSQSGGPGFGWDTVCSSLLIQPLGNGCRRFADYILQHDLFNYSDTPPPIPGQEQLLSAAMLIDVTGY